VAHTFITPSQVASVAVKALGRRAVLAGTVTRDYDQEFRGAVGDTVTVRIESTSTAAEYNGSGTITYSDITEIPVAVQLSKWVYDAKKLTDKEAALNVKNVQAQVVAPQFRAVARKLESYVAAQMAAPTYPAGQKVAWGANLAGVNAATWGAILDAGQILDDNEVDPADRFLAVGSAGRKAILSDPDLKRFDGSNSTDALRKAIVGEYAGFTVVFSPLINAQKAYAYHRSALILATLAPPVPEGAVAGSSAAEDGFGMTWIRDYDPDVLSDRSVVQAFAGTAPVYDGATVSSFKRAVELTIPTS